MKTARGNQPAGGVRGEKNYSVINKRKKDKGLLFITLL